MSLPPPNHHPAASPRDHIKRGFLWIGSSSVVSRLFEVGGAIVVLFFLDRAQMGQATVAWSIAVMIEALNGLGVGTAILQAKSLTKRQLSSVWIFAVGSALLLCGMLALGSHSIATFYRSPGIRWMIALSGVKVIFLGAALVPLQLLNRQLRYEAIGAITAAATLLSVGLAIVLAAAGAGAWALVIGHVSHGLFTLIGVYLVAPFWPRERFRLPEIRELLVFGSKVALSGLLYHFYRNLDYLVVGKLLSVETLGVYRVAFDIAFLPSMAVLGVVNRTVYPVFARIAHDPEELTRTFWWTIRSLLLVLAPIVCLTCFGADALLRLVANGRWILAVPIVQLLTWVALIRGVTQVIPQVFHAAGRPGLALWDSLFSLVLMACTLTWFITWLGDSHGAISAAYAWLASYPALLLVLLLMARGIMPITGRAFLRSITPGLGGVALLSLALWGASNVVPKRSPILTLAVLLLIVTALYAGYVRAILRVHLSDLLHTRTAPGSDDGPAQH